MSFSARWVSLAVIGWLVYAFVRALGIMIILDLPAYDWQWYVALIAWLLGLTLYILGLFPRSKRAAGVLLSLLGWALLGYNGFGQTVRLYPARADKASLSFWAFSDLSEMPAPVLDDLHAAGGRLYLSLGDNAVKDERGRALRLGLQRLAHHQVEVVLSPYASDFLSVPVHIEWIANVQATVRFLEQENVSNVSGLIGDAERPLKMPPDVLGSEQAGFDQTVEALGDFITWMKMEHPKLRLGVTANWPWYLDRLDGDADLARTQRSPVDPPGGWGFLNVMTYSSYVPASWRAYYVYVVERAIALQYDTDRPSHLIGLVGGGFPWEPLLDFDGLVRDAQLSRALGVREIVVFQLNGALEAFGEDFVRRFAEAVNNAPVDLNVDIPFSRPASVLIFSVLVVDALFDARRHGGWPGVSWLIVSSIITKWATARLTQTPDWPSN